MSESVLLTSLFVRGERDLMELELELPVVEFEEEVLVLLPVLYLRGAWPGGCFDGRLGCLFFPVILGCCLVVAVRFLISIFQRRFQKRFLKREKVFLRPSCSETETGITSAVLSAQSQC